MIRTYRLTDKKGKIVCQGAMRDLAHYLDVTLSAVSHALARGKEIQGFKIDFILDEKREKIITSKGLSSHYREWVIPIFEKYGNVFVLRNAEVYAEELKEKGYQVHIRKCKCEGYVIEQG